MYKLMCDFHKFVRFYKWYCDILVIEQMTFENSEKSELEYNICIILLKAKTGSERALWTTLYNIM